MLRRSIRFHGFAPTFHGARRENSRNVNLTLYTSRRALIRAQPAFGVRKSSYLTSSIACYYLLCSIYQDFRRPDVKMTEESRRTSLKSRLRMRNIQQVNFFMSRHRDTNAAAGKYFFIRNAHPFEGCSSVMVLPALKMAPAIAFDT